MSGGKLTGVRNERSLVGKKFVGNKPEDDDKEGEGRPVADAAAVEKQRGQRNSKARKGQKVTQVWNPSIYRDPKP